MSRPAFEINGRPATREDFYALACDPHRAVAIEACAGAGKTWILVERMVRALKAGCAAHEILAITFTRKAAGEMRERLHARLRDDEPDLYRRILEEGRPVQVRTFHSWFAQLLRMAPVAVLDELALPVAFELVEDDEPLVRLVWRRFHQALVDDAEAHAAFGGLVRVHGRHQTRAALEAALARRVEFQLAQSRGDLDGQVPPATECFAELGGAQARADWLLQARVREPLLGAVAVLAKGGKTAQKQAAMLLEALNSGSVEGVGAALLTREGKPRKLGDDPDVLAAQDVALRLVDAVCQDDAAQHHRWMVLLTRVLLREYAGLKHDRAVVDMSDVERAAFRLLSDDLLGAWVQQRLDTRVRHLLIDEFQDTNPMQWRALSSWLSSYAGAGGGASPGIFIVGDPKQSIYRFRRAEPQVFRAAQAFIRDGFAGDLLACNHTRRCSRGVVRLVNEVLMEAQEAGEFEGFGPHTTESVAVGEVIRLPRIIREHRQPRVVATSSDTGSNADQWRDTLECAKVSAEESLRLRESRQAAAWIAGRIRDGVAPRDLLVLARKRDRLSGLADALREVGVPHSRPEDYPLAEAPEVQDILALLDALVSPGHDLSLARALKSPLFGATDPMLIRVAHAVGRTGRHWIDALPECDLVGPTREPVYLTLERWRAWLKQWPPHDAIGAIFRDGDVLARFAQAAPATRVDSVLANLRALLGAALAVDGGRYLTPYAFLRAVRADQTGAAQPQDEDCVRLLTIHGAKGLEASHVLILDADSAPARPDSMSVLVDWPAEDEAPRQCIFLAREQRAPRSVRGLLERETRARAREELNALYVAMTRAATTLAVSSIEPHIKAERSWWDRVSQRISDELTVVPSPHRAVKAAMPVIQELPTLSPEAVLHSGTEAAQATPQVATLSSRVGQAMHRLLEWTSSSAGQWPDFQLAQLRVDFDLDETRAGEAMRLARSILGGEAAWAWNADVVEWAAAELELVYRGRRLRLDRVVRRRDTGQWWILDFKSAMRPEADDALRQQVREYRDALLNAHPGERVVAALVAGDGRVVTVE